MQTLFQKIQVNRNIKESFELHTQTLMKRKIIYIISIDTVYTVFLLHVAKNIIVSGYEYLKKIIVSGYEYLKKIIVSGYEYLKKIIVSGYEYIKR